jgi:hypothetical protein
MIHALTNIPQLHITQLCVSTFQLAFHNIILFTDTKFIWMNLLLVVRIRKSQGNLIFIPVDT